MFELYNPNPYGIFVGDCVIRAICKVTGKSWEDVYMDIAHLAITREVLLERMNNQDISKDRSLVRKMIGQLEKGDDILYGNNS